MFIWRRGRARGGFGGSWRRGGRGVVARRKRKGAARPSGRTAGRLRKATPTGGSRASAEEEARADRSGDRTGRSDRATRRWAGLTRGGPGGRGGRRFASWAGKRRRE